jgi:hypothetical protein
MRVNIMSSIAALLVTASSRAVTAFSTHSITSTRAASVSEIIFVPAGCSNSNIVHSHISSSILIHTPCFVPNKNLFTDTTDHNDIRP